MKTVWILGAGFSMPLGAPSFAGLFDIDMQDRLLAMFDSKDERGQENPEVDRFNNAVQHIFHLYGWERSRTDGSWRRHPRWRDPESFLDYLDRGVGKGLKDENGRLLKRFKCTMEDARNARRVLAAACQLFLPTATDSELWSTYAQWVQTLTPDDTVLTFNYDRVIEEAGEGHVDVFMPCTRQGDSRIVQIEPRADRPTLFKMHGSVDWEYNLDHVVPWKDSSELLLAGRSAQRIEEPSVAIGAPGPGKALMASGLFQQTWNRAIPRLTDADRIVIIGYRFPETDAIALKRILGAIGSKQESGITKHPRVITVLGDDVNHPHSRRLRALLVSAMQANYPAKAVEVLHEVPSRPGGREVVQLPFWSQDYLNLGCPGARD